MEKTFLGQHKMGKHTHANYRRCSLGNLKNNQHIQTTRNLKCPSETRRESQRRESAEAYYSGGLRSTRSASEYGSDREIFREYANCSCPAEKLRKEPEYREKRNGNTRTKSFTGDSSQRFLKRSISCGSVRYGDAVDTCSSSGTDSDCSDVFTRDDASSMDTCLECNGESSLERCRGFPSMPNLVKVMPNNNKEIAQQQAGNNHLGLEVMLSLINGPMQSVIDSKDEKIRGLERVIESLENENKRMKSEAQKPGDTTKIFTLEKTLENCIRQIEQLEEANKTAQEKVRLLEDLRKNDKECIDILRAQTNDLEKKLTKSDERVREAEKESKNQSQWLKLQYEKQVQELQSALRAKETKLRELDKVKSRVTKQKQELEDKRSNENELHTKMCEQVLGLKRDLQLHQTRLNILEREKRALEENLSQSENLQRQDQKSSYVLQMKIVELQEKLDLSYKKHEDLVKQREVAEQKRQVLVEQLEQATKSTSKGNRSVEGASKGFNPTKVDGNYAKANKITNSSNEGSQLQGRKIHNESNPERCTTILDRNHLALDMNDALRDKVVELQKKIYKGQQTNEAHVQELGYCKQSDKWRVKEDSYDEQRSPRDSMDESVPVRDAPMKKMELAFTGDKRRPSSDDSSSSNSSACSSRRGSAESPHSERRQLKVLKVRKVSKENISHFQQNMMHRQSNLKDVSEIPHDSDEKLNLTGNRQSAFKQVKERTSSKS